MICQVFGDCHVYYSIPISHFMDLQILVSIIIFPLFIFRWGWRLTAASRNNDSGSKRVHLYDTTLCKSTPISHVLVFMFWPRKHRSIQYLSAMCYRDLSVTRKVQISSWIEHKCTNILYRSWPSLSISKEEIKPTRKKLIVSSFQIDQFFQYIKCAGE
jgi:hypothetical protein